MKPAEGDVLREMPFRRVPLVAPHCNLTHHRPLMVMDLKRGPVIVHATSPPEHSFASGRDRAQPRVGRSLATANLSNL